MFERLKLFCIILYHFDGQTKQQTLKIVCSQMILSISQSDSAPRGEISLRPLLCKFDYHTMEDDPFCQRFEQFSALTACEAQTPVSKNRS